MLGQVPVSALLGLTADVWEVQAKSAVAAGFAEIGNEERASALVTEALTDADRISSTRARREGLAAAAETLTPFHDRPWAQAAARRLLDLRVVRPGQAEIAAWSALAREANQLPEEVPLTQDVAARLIVIMREIRSLGTCRTTGAICACGRIWTSTPGMPSTALWTSCPRSQATRLRR